jgi:hypothetical protein
MFSLWGHADMLITFLYTPTGWTTKANPYLLFVNYVSDVYSTNYSEHYRLKFATFPNRFCMKQASNLYSVLSHVNSFYLYMIILCQ